MHTNIALVIGTRPEAIKLAPVAKALAARGLISKLVLTGQHADLRADEFGLSGFPLVQLNCRGMEDPHRHVGAVTRAVRALVAGHSLVVVQGDTSSALGGALAAVTQGIPLAHVEAGLRSFDRTEPWPEEEYRTAIDANSDLLFAPTEESAGNLKNEGVKGAVFVTGNSGIDVLLKIVDEFPSRSLRETGLPCLLVTCHRRENWGERLDNILAALTRLASEAVARIEFILPPNPNLAAAVAARLDRLPGLHLHPPRRHRELLLMMREVDLILSDSGGIQEEAPALGTPLLVLRRKTERPEGLATGNAKLVGTDADEIYAEVKSLLGDSKALDAMRQPALPYGDGRSAPRIAAIIDQWLEQRTALLRTA